MRHVQCAQGTPVRLRFNFQDIAVSMRANERTPLLWRLNATSLNESEALNQSALANADELPEACRHVCSGKGVIFRGTPASWRARQTKGFGGINTPSYLHCQRVHFTNIYTLRSLVDKRTPVKSKEVYAVFYWFICRCMAGGANLKVLCSTVSPGKMCLLKLTAW